MKNKLTLLRAYLRSALDIIKILPQSISDGFDEMRWSRDVAYVAGPTCLQYGLGCEPRSHPNIWPFVRIPEKDDSEKPAAAIVEKVEEVLTPPHEVESLAKARAARKGK